MLRLLRAEVFVSAPLLGVPNFLTLIQSRNKMLHTEHWMLRHQQSTDKGQFFVWVFVSKNYQPHFRLGRITFRVRSQARDEAGTA